MASLAEVFVTVQPETKDFSKDLKKKLKRVDAKEGGQKVAQSFGGGFNKGLSRVLKVAGGLFAARAIGGFFKSATLEAEEAASAVANTNQILKQTGEAANIGSKGVDKLTKSLSLKTGVDKTVVRDGSNILLTFKNIRNEAGKGNDVFNRANGLALDLAATFKTDVKSTATQLGKALDNPIKGVSALTRVGVSFTEQEKEKIKTLQESGDTLGAQQIILKALDSQVGGTAEASADSSAKIANAFREVREAIGRVLLPIMDKLARFVVDRALPALSDFGGFAKRELLPRLKDLGKFIKTDVLPVLLDLGTFLKDEVVPVLVRLGKWIVRNKDFFIPFVGVLASAVVVMKAIKIATAAWAVAQGVLNAILLANPIGLIIVAVAALIGIVVAIEKRTGFFSELWSKAWDTIQAAVSAVFNWLKDNWPKLLLILTGPIGAAVLIVIKNWGRIRSTAQGLWDGLKSIWKTGIRFVLDIFFGFVEKILDGAAKAFGWVPKIGDKLKNARDDFKQFRKNVNKELSDIDDEKIRIKVEPQIQSTGPGSILAGFRGGGSGGRGGSGGHGRGGAFANIKPADLRAMGGNLDLKTAGLNAGPFASAATDFVSKTKAGFSKAIRAAIKSIMPGGRFAFPLPRGAYRVGVPINGYPGHTGQDFPAPSGTPVYAPFSGSLSAINLGNRSYGRYANIVAGPWRSIQAHLSGFARGSGFVRAGELVGFVGSTGNSTGPHLHQEFRRNGAVINPRSVLSYDRGGFLPPGLSIAYNGTGAPEPVGHALSGGAHFHFHGPVTSKQGAQDMVLSAYNQLVRERKIR